MRPTASRTGLVLACMHWTLFDDVLDAAEKSPPVVTGIEFHGMACGHIEGRVVTTADERANVLFAIWRKSFKLPAGAIAEPAFAWDPATDTAIELGRNIGRDYSKAPEGWLCGSADVAHMQSAAVVVTDWKCSNEFDQDPERYVPQLRALALMAARAYGADEAICRIVHVRESGIEVQEFALDSLELDAIASELRTALAQTTEPKPGAHCVRCPAKADCPATKAALVAAPSWDLSTPEAIAEFWPKLLVVEDALEALRKRVKEYVKEHGEVRLLTGKRLRLVESQGRESVSVSGIEKALDAETVAKLRADGVIKRGGTIQSMKETA